MPKNRPPKPNSQRTQTALRPPGYRSRRGYEQALVTLTDSRTKKRRDYWLGPFGSPQSRELYHLLIAQWEALDRRLPDQLYAQQRIAMQIRSTRRAHGGESTLEADETISDLIGAYWRWTRTYYSSSERTLIKGALRIVRKLFGSTPASEFGPNRLRLVRDDMVRGDPHGDRPRIAWSRPYVNGQIHRVCAMFKWAASHEKLPASNRLCRPPVRIQSGIEQWRSYSLSRWKDAFGIQSSKRLCWFGCAPALRIEDKSANLWQGEWRN